MKNIENRLENAEKFFLSSFSVPRNISNTLVLGYEDWKICLGNDPKEVVNQLIEKKLLKECAPQLSISKNLNKRNLLEILNIEKTNSNKSELINKLNEDQKKKILDDLKVKNAIYYECSDIGKEVVNVYLNNLAVNNGDGLYTLNIPKNKAKKLLNWLLVACVSGIIGNNADRFSLGLLKDFSHSSQKRNNWSLERLQLKKLIESIIKDEKDKIIEYLKKFNYEIILSCKEEIKKANKERRFYFTRDHVTANYNPFIGAAPFLETYELALKCKNNHFFSSKISIDIMILDRLRKRITELNQANFEINCRLDDSANGGWIPDAKYFNRYSFPIELEEFIEELLIEKKLRIDESKKEEKVRIIKNEISDFFTKLSLTRRRINPSELSEVNSILNNLTNNIILFDAKSIGRILSFSFKILK
jgi:hypothetical protein